MKPILIAGLGNPGPEYRGTWHNLGYRVVEKAARDYQMDFAAGKGEYLYARKRVSGRDLILMKPISFMNISGRAILQFVEQEDLYHEDILMICDDINLPMGKIRLRGKGSDGGHKGLASVIYYLGTENFPRLRLGIYTGGEINNLKYYVLSEVPSEYADSVNIMLEHAVSAADCFIKNGLDKAMTEFNRREEPSLLE